MNMQYILTRAFELKMLNWKAAFLDPTCTAAYGSLVDAAMYFWNVVCCYHDMIFVTSGMAQNLLQPIVLALPTPPAPLSD